MLFLSAVVMQVGSFVEQYEGSLSFGEVSSRVIELSNECLR